MIITEFRFRAWDRTDDFPSGLAPVDITKTGGNSAFSNEIATGKVVIPLEPPNNTWDNTIKSYQDSSDLQKPPGIILHDAVLAGRSAFLVGNTTGVLSSGQSSLGGFNDTWLAQVDIETGDVQGSLLLGTTDSDTRAKIAWSQTDPDTVYVSFRALSLSDFKETGWISKYNFRTDELKSINVTNSSNGTSYPVDIGTDENGNIYALFNIKGSRGSDGKADSRVIIYNSNLQQIGSVDFGESFGGITFANKIHVTSPGKFSVAGFSVADDRPADNFISYYDPGYDTIINTNNNTEAIYLASFSQGSSEYFTEEEDLLVSFTSGENQQDVIKTNDVVTGFYVYGTEFYISTRSSVIVSGRYWESGKIFKPQQIITGLSVDENGNVYVLGKTELKDSSQKLTGGSSWITKYEKTKEPQSINYAPILVEADNYYFPNWQTYSAGFWHEDTKIYLDENINSNSPSNGDYRVEKLIQENLVKIADYDGDTLGIAIINVDNANGDWRFSNNNGASWFSIKHDLGSWSYFNSSDNVAHLLGPKTLIRFIPNDGYIGESSFQFRLWDMTDYPERNDLFGVITDVSIAEHGGSTPYSSGIGTIKVEITNYAPIFDSTYTPEILNISYKNTNPAGYALDSLLPYGAVLDGTYSFFTDSQDEEGLYTGELEYLTQDKGKRSIALISVDNSNGKWEFATNNDNWQDVGEVSEANARLLSEEHKIRFVPNSGYLGEASFTFRAWDQTNGNGGETFNVSATGGTTAFSTDTRTATIKVFNTAPVLTRFTTQGLDIIVTLPDPTLPSISHNNKNNTGRTVAEIVPDNAITDADGAIKAIAVTSIDNTNGVWQYSTNNGESWLDFGDISLSQARLLESNHHIRFIPNDNFVGNATFSFKAWDGSSGIAGATADTTNHGGETPFSVDNGTAQISITNSAPVLPASTAILGNLTSITNKNTIPLGNLVADIISDNVITDNDDNPQKSIALTEINDNNGKWQYSLDFGETWLDINPISETNALLLDAFSRIRFLPNSDFLGDATFSFRAWDQITGTVGQYVNTSSNGGDTAFSSVIRDAQITITALDAEGESILTALDTGLNPDTKRSFEYIEVIGNNTSKAPTKDVDFYKIQLNEGDVINVQIITGAINSPLDAMIEFYNSEGERLGFSDKRIIFDPDAENPTENIETSNEPFLTLTAPQTENYYIRVSASGNESPSPFIEESPVNINPTTSGSYKLVMDIEQQDNGNGGTVDETPVDGRIIINASSFSDGEIIIPPNPDTASRFMGDSRGNIFTPSTASDFFDLTPGGANTIQGTLAQLNRDIIEGFDRTDKITVQDSVFSADQLQVTLGSAILEIDSNNDGDTDSTITLEGDFKDALFFVNEGQNSTDISYDVFSTAMYRFQNQDVPGTYLFAGEAESQSIRDNFPNFKEEGLAFKVGNEGDSLIRINRFQNQDAPGTYLFAGEAESQSIRANFPNFKEEGIAFYAAAPGSSTGESIYRFQSLSNLGTYIFVGGEERQSIIDNFSSAFVEEGIAFELLA